jgi:hypothetical protein
MNTIQTHIESMLYKGWNWISVLHWEDTKFIWILLNSLLLEFMMPFSLLSENAWVGDRIKSSEISISILWWTYETALVYFTWNWGENFNILNVLAFTSFLCLRTITDFDLRCVTEHCWGFIYGESVAKAIRVIWFKYFLVHSNMLIRSHFKCVAIPQAHICILYPNPLIQKYLFFITGSMNLCRNSSTCYQHRILEAIHNRG